jgi:hypothetical protein
MSILNPIADGTYFIGSQLTSTYVTLDSAVEGTIITAWDYDGGPHQQVTPILPSTFLISSE